MTEPIVLWDGADPIPARWELCPRCHGEGTSDAWEGGMTASEMAELGIEFMEDYAAGHYSAPCRKCGGERAVRVIDEDRATPEQIATYRDYWRAWEVDQKTRRMESGYY